MRKSLKAQQKTNNMKTIKNLYENMLDYEHIKRTIILASRGKKKRREVREVLGSIDIYVDKIYRMLATESYYVLPFRNKEIVEKGKTRMLTISPFYPNRILDYLIVEALKPYIRKSMYEYCIGNIDGRGMSYGKKAIAKKYKHYKYYIKLDIHKFYPSVDSLKLIEFIRHKVKDERFVNLASYIISQCKDLPIGSYYSQWFSNWYLEDIDHYIKEELRVPFYVRYVDDMLIMGNSKRQLYRAMYNINRKLKTKGLRLKNIERVKTISECPIDYLGFRFTIDGVFLRTRNFKALNKAVKHIRRNKHASVSQARSILSYAGWLKQIKSGYNYYKNHIQGLVNFGRLKRIVSSMGLKNNVLSLRRELIGGKVT